MTDPIHISFDSETWGKRAGCDGRSIGACIMRPGDLYVPEIDFKNNDFIATDEVFYISLDNPLMGSYSRDHYNARELDMIGGHNRKYDLHRDPATVDFWYDQPEEARQAFVNPVDLKDGVLEFINWLERVGVNPKDEDSARIWSHGGGYDCPILEAWCYATNLPVPYHYRAIRDTRTLFDYAKVGNHKKFLDEYRQGVPHHALHDSTTQGRAIVAAINVLEG